MQPIHRREREVANDHATTAPYPADPSRIRSVRIDGKRGAAQDRHG